MKTGTVYIFILLLVFSCKKKCNEDISAKVNLDAQLDGYFGVFKKGNYWVYENQDQTKRDSIYVTSYDNHVSLNSPPCQSIEEISFVLKSSGKEVVVSDSICMYGKDKELYINNCYGIFFFPASWLLVFTPDTILSDNLPIKHLSSLTLNNQLFTGNLIGMYSSDTLFMQKNVGIIGWKKNNDTYMLVKKYLQP